VVHSQLTEGKAFEAYNCDTYLAIEDRHDICLELIKCGILPYQVRAKKERAKYAKVDHEELKLTACPELGHTSSIDFHTCVQKILKEQKNGILERKAKAVWEDRIYH